MYRNGSRTNRTTSSVEYFSVADGHESGNDSDDEVINDPVMETIESVLLNIDAESDEENDEIEGDRANGVSYSDDCESGDRGRGWRRKEFEVEVQPFPIFDETSDTDMSPSLYFKYFFSEDMFEEIADETNRYLFQKKAPKTLDTNPKEIEILVGLLFKMGVVQMPSVRDYWAKETYYEPVASKMSRSRFETLCRYLHFVDNTDDHLDKSDKGWKIRPFMEALRQNFLKIKPNQNQCIDEISISYRGKKGPRQYNPKNLQDGILRYLPGRILLALFTTSIFIQARLEKSQVRLE